MRPENMAMGLCWFVSGSWMYIYTLWFLSYSDPALLPGLRAVYCAPLHENTSSVSYTASSVDVRTGSSVFVYRLQHNKERAVRALSPLRLTGSREVKSW